jgi:hypothetical protein
MSAPVYDYPAYAEWSRGWSDGHPTPAAPWSCDASDPVTEPIPVIRLKPTRSSTEKVWLTIAMVFMVFFMLAPVVVLVLLNVAPHSEPSVAPMTTTTISPNYIR